MSKTLYTRQDLVTLQNVNNWIGLDGIHALATMRQERLAVLVYWLVRRKEECLYALRVKALPRPLYTRNIDYNHNFGQPWGWAYLHWSRWLIRVCAEVQRRRDEERARAQAEQARKQQVAWQAQADALISAERAREERARAVDQEHQDTIDAAVELLRCCAYRWVCVHTLSGISPREVRQFYLKHVGEDLDASVRVLNLAEMYAGLGACPDREDDHLHSFLNGADRLENGPR